MTKLNFFKDAVFISNLIPSYLSCIECYRGGNPQKAREYLEETGNLQIVQKYEKTCEELIKRCEKCELEKKPSTMIHNWLKDIHNSGIKSISS